ncbi:MAG: glycoside hydrolase family 3 C-terminal domain-containing protein [Bacteroidales bacterium]|nr:glycoside hydrolase family 3 C-terminal domain-containing protein [Bacteroidales bacterium]
MNKLLLLCSVFIATNINLNAQGQDFTKDWTDYNKNGKKDIYEDDTQPVEKRLVDLVSQMTLEEMVHQMRSWTYLNVDTWDPDSMPLGLIGHIAHNVQAEAATKRINKAQKKQITETRLGIPILFFEEALHGLKTEKATSFPQAICLASTWNLDLMKEVSKAIAVETKTRGVRQVLSPVVDLARDPRWGRSQETYGEDPFLASKMAVAFCKSFEDMGVVTTPKHFVANSGDGGRDSWAQYYSERYLNELYFKPYKACIQKAGSRCIMPSYNTLNGIPCLSDPWLLTKKARDEWGFTGFYGSDFNGVSNIKSLHHITDNETEIAKLCVNAGMDVEWPKALVYGEPLMEAIEKGWITKETIMQTAARILRVKFEIGLFEHPYGEVKRAVATNDCDAHRALALEAARQGIVLMKNNLNTLPLQRNKIDTILLIGHDAREVDLGNYSGKGMKKVSLYEALETKYPEIELLYHPGVASSPTHYSLIPSGIFTNGAEKGLKAEIYDNHNFEGEPFISKTLKNLYFRSNGGVWGAPAEGRKWNSTAMRIYGEFTPADSFNANLAIEATGALCVYVNGEPVVNNMGTKGKKDGFFDDAVGQIGVISDLGNPYYLSDFLFEKGKKYEVLIEYMHPNVSHLQMTVNWDQKLGLEEDLLAISELAKRADVVLAVPDGIIEGEFKDRSSVLYPPEEEMMMHALAETGVPVVAVLVNGAAMAISNWDRNIPAILETWYSGEESGNAIAEVLFGETNPSGKIPVTFPQTDGQLPLTYDYRPVGRRTGFQDPLKGKPQYPFGHGLSYTTFEYSDVKLSTSKVMQGKSVTVYCKITNTGTMAGYETVQVYIRDLYSSVVRPIKELKGFQKVYLKPGVSTQVAIRLSPSELSLWNKDMEFVMEPGTVEVYVGSSSEDIRLRDEFEIIE